jgi:hypothetical protein
VSKNIHAVSSQKAGAAPTPPIAGRGSPACCPRNIEKMLHAFDKEPREKQICVTVCALSLDGTSFVELQSIPTVGANDWAFFTIGSDPYLAVANYRYGDFNLNSKI